MTTRSILRSIVVVFVLLVVQNTVFSEMRFAGAHPDVMILVPVMAGALGGAERGAVFGFLSGLGVDLLAPTTFGLWALVGTLLGYASGVLAFGRVRGRAARVAVGAAGAVAGLAGFALLGALLGQPTMLTVYLQPVLAVAVPTAIVLALPEFALLRWAMVGPLTRAVTVTAGGAAGEASSAAGAGAVGVAVGARGASGVVTSRERARQRSAVGSGSGSVPGFVGRAAGSLSWGRPAATSAAARNAAAGASRPAMAPTTGRRLRDRESRGGGSGDGAGSDGAERGRR